MALVDQWRSLETVLPEGWGDARLSLTIADAGDCDRAAALLGPASPGRTGKVMRFSASQSGASVGPEAVGRLLRRLDAEGIDGELELVSADAAAAPVELARTTLAESWDAALAELPSDWSDLYVEVELFSTDYFERAALLAAPLNPARLDGKPGFRLRCARTFGYGASPGMTRRCLERCDAEQIRGRVRVLRALSSTQPVATQGPVWHVGGRSV